MNRAQVLRARRRRRRIILSFAVTASLGILVTTGVLVGAGVGVAAERVRSSTFLASLIDVAEPGLPAAKVAPPKPFDISGPAVACAASSLTITVLPERTSLTAGEGINLHVTATNTGRYPCLVNGGMENLRVRLVNPAGVTVWSAADCSLEGSRELLMGPGYYTAWDIGWNGRPSEPGRCSTDDPVKPGTWNFIASLAEVAYSDSDPATIVVRGVVAPEPEPEVIDDLTSDVALD